MKVDVSTDIVINRPPETVERYPLRGWIRRVEGQAASALHERELGAVLVEGHALLGYDHTTLLGARHTNRIGDGMSVAGWIRLLERAGFGLTDVLLRDADQALIGALKSIDPDSR